MTRLDFIKKIETEIKNGEINTRENMLDLIHDIYDKGEIFDYANEGLDGILVSIEHSVSKPNVEISIDWEITEQEKSGDTSYFYEIS